MADVGQGCQDLSPRQRIFGMPSGVGSIDGAMATHISNYRVTIVTILNFATIPADKNQVVLDYDGETAKETSDRIDAETAAKEAGI